MISSVLNKSCFNKDFNRQNTPFGKVFPGNLHSMAVPMNEKPHWNKTFVFVDSSKSKFTDINGDRCPDISHGAFLKLAMENSLMFRPEKIKILDVKREGTEISDKNILKALKAAEEDKNIDYLNMSINKKAFFTDKDIQAQGINQDNIKSKASELRTSGILSDTRLEIIKTLESIAKKTKVFLSTGNFGENCFGIFNLAKGVNNVGYLNLTYSQKTKDGKQTTEDPHSGKNSLITMNAKSNEEIYPVLQDGSVVGYSFSKEKANKNIVDLPFSEITGNETVSYFAGKDAKSVEAKESHYELYREYLSNLDENKYEPLLKKNIFSIKKLINNNLLDNESSVMILTTLNGRKYENYYIDGKSLLGLKANFASLYKQGKTSLDKPTFIFDVKDGKVVYNPYEPNKPAVKKNCSSTASPVGMAQIANNDYLLQKNRKIRSKKAL